MKAVKKLLFLLLLPTFASGAAFGQDDESIGIVASIKPIGLIASDLLGERGRITTLVQGGSSPHDYSLKVSDMTAMSNADLVIWMGPELEHFLEKVINRSSHKQVLTLSKPYEKSEHIENGHGHDRDLHYWLDPARAKQIAIMIARRIIEQSPNRAEDIEGRLELILKDYTLLKSEIDGQLQPYQSVPFMVDHNGYDYLVGAFGMRQIAWITQSPEQSAGAKRLYDLQKQLAGYEVNGLEQKRPRCLFVESSHQSSSVKNIASRLQLDTYPLDLLAAEETITSYRQLMSAIANTMAECLSGN